MCTLSWCRSDGGYDLFFNRDELRTRQRALSPTAHGGSPPYVAPRDPESGGTWILANTLGVTVCVLNRFDVEHRAGAGDRRSRGNLVVALADLARPADLPSRLASLAVDRYDPFTLAAVDVSSAVVASSDGRTIGYRTQTVSGLVATSSGHEPESVARARAETFSKVVPVTADCLADVHRSHEPARGFDSVCMHRDEASTVSFSHIAVTVTTMAFRYADGPPCVTSLGDPIVLNRVVSTHVD